MKAAFLSIVGFEELQHYKQRNPPWIKLHRHWWDNPAFEALPDASKAHFIGLCVLASKCDNSIPYEVEWISRKIGSNVSIDFKALIASKLLASSGASCLRSASKSLAPVETEKSRGETETEAEKIPPAEKRGGEPDEAYEEFQIWHFEITGAEYISSTGDFVQLARLRKSNNVEAKKCPLKWVDAVHNYFASPLGTYALTDLCKNFPVFRNTPVDQYRKPVNHQGKSNGQPKSRTDVTRENAESLLRDIQDKRSLQRLFEPGNAGDLRK